MRSRLLLAALALMCPALLAQPVPATMISPAPSSTLRGSNVIFTWDAGSGWPSIVEYYVWIGTALGTPDLFVYTGGLSQSVAFDRLPIDGRTIYVRLYSVTSDGSRLYRDYTYQAALSTAIIPAEITGPAPGSTLGSSATFHWDSGFNISQYHIYVGTAGPGSADLCSENTGSYYHYYTCGIPRDGRMIYVRLWSRVAGSAEWLYRDYTYNASFVVVLATLTSPAPGSIFAGGAVIFNWDAGSAVFQYHLYVGTRFGIADICSQNTDTVRSYTCNGIPLDGRTIFVRLWSRTLPDNWSYRDYTYTAASTGAVLASMISPVPGSTLAGSAVTFEWDAGVSVSGYHLYVGAQPGMAQICSQYTGTNCSYTCNGIPTDGLPIYVRLWSWVGGTTWLYRDYIYTAAGTINVTLAAITSPAPGSTFTGSSVTFKWDSGTNISEYHLYVGTAGAGSADVCSQNTGSGRSLTCGGIPTDGRTIYVRLWSRTARTVDWAYRDYSYTAVFVTTLAVITSPAPGSIFPGSSATFNWDTGSAVTMYHLYVGSRFATADICSQNTGMERSFTCNGIPMDGRVIFVRLWSRTLPDETWSYRDYTYIASAKGAVLAAMTSPRPYSRLAGSSVTFEWDVGIGVFGYHIYVGTEPGGAQICSQYTAMQRTYTCNGLPTNGLWVYVRLWSWVGGTTWLYTDYTYIAAFTTPINIGRMQPGAGGRAFTAAPSLVARN